MILKACFTLGQGRPDHLPSVAGSRGPDDENHEAGDTEKHTNAMDDTIDNFFPNRWSVKGMILWV